MKKIVFALLLFFCSLTFTFAQNDPLTKGSIPSVQGEGGGPDPDRNVPVDQGDIFLLIAGIGFAVWCLKKAKERTTLFKEPLKE
ncbi:MAG: hypothetical protein KBB75_00125 [Candidatus Pacebacteria bacterium]|jgi:hypothetical protein|nr:hypothetical protein [Candidatus Paceibacterota bacterium]